MIRSSDDKALHLALILAHSYSFNEVHRGLLGEVADDAGISFSASTREASRDSFSKISDDGHPYERWDRSPSLPVPAKIDPLIVNIQEHWKADLFECLMDKIEKVGRDPSLSGNMTDEDERSFMNSSIEAIPDILLNSKSIPERILAVLTSAGLVPNEEESPLPEVVEILGLTFDSLVTIISNKKENPWLRLLSVCAFTKFAASSIKHYLSFNTLELGINAIMGIAVHSRNPLDLRESAVSSLGFLSDTLLWNAPITRTIYKILSNIVNDEKNSSLKTYAIKAYGRFRVESVVSSDDRIVEGLEKVLNSDGNSQLKNAARTLLQLIRKTAKTGGSGGGSSSPDFSGPSQNSSGGSQGHSLSPLNSINFGLQASPLPSSFVYSACLFSPASLIR